MKHARTSATATLLQSGKVLIAGGGAAIDTLAESIFASAELYDPKTGKFTQTGSMTTARANHIATLLDDGRVLITGGWGCSNAKKCSPDNAAASDLDRLASAELYDPATGKFSAAGSMFTPREGGTATLLPDGRVLLACGGRYPETAELYDPKTGLFARTGKLVGFGNHTTATLLPNGKVLLTGDTDSGPRAELYDPATGKFTPISFEVAPGAAPSAQYMGQTFERTAPDTATLLKDGRVLLFEAGYLETYDPATGMFSPAGFFSPPGQWNFPTATLLADGRVLFAGGSWLTDPNAFTYVVASAAALYDPVDGPQLIGSMPGPRGGQTITLLANGSVLIVGGGDDQGKSIGSAELFKP